MSILTKRILCWILTAFDIFVSICLVISFFLEPTEIGILIVMLVWCVGATYFHLDYLSQLRAQQEAADHQAVEEQMAGIHDEIRQDQLEEQRSEVDDALAEDIRKAPDTEPVPDPDELKDLLAKDHLDGTDTSQKQE